MLDFGKDLKVQEKDKKVVSANEKATGFVTKIGNESANNFELPSKIPVLDPRNLVKN